jgi:beta-galactosidase
MRRATLAAMLGLGAIGAACLPVIRSGSLPPTLTVDSGSGVAVQNGMPVPTFEFQPRPRIDLTGRWRVERMELDNELSLTDRESALSAIEEDGGGRHLPDYDDAGWERIAVPGTLNAPPDEPEIGGWYRRTFNVPARWIGRVATLKVSTANYIADVWINGTWIGYHEGGSTPFAFDVSALLVPNAENQITVRVDNPPWGTRTDIVPWGLGDWWNYGGLTGPVWIEAGPALQIVRADVTPHLDAAEVSVVIRDAPAVVQPAGAEPERSETGSGDLIVRASVLPAETSEENLLDPDVRGLLPDGARTLDERETTLDRPGLGEHAVANLAFAFAEADLWMPGAPALYVLRVSIAAADEPEPPLDARDAPVADELWTSFGLRHVAVDQVNGQLLLNGEGAFLEGVGLHDEEISFDEEGNLLTGTPGNDLAALRERLAAAAAVNATLLRPGHTPADPGLLMLADRLGFAVWEEIPLYHFTPLSFETAMNRGIPQQMLREMALRDMNRPSVLFHGLANESTGQEERAAALRELHDIDREIDGTRLTAQAAYGFDPADPTHEALDLAGFTFYFGVFYGEDIYLDTARALRTARETNPTKPVAILEFGRWADTEADEARQLAIFEDTHRALSRFRGDRRVGFVGIANWWTLWDFATQVPGLNVEDFGLYRPDGTLRPAGEAAAETFGGAIPETVATAGESDLRPAPQLPNRALEDWRLAGYLAYAFAVSTGMIAIATLVLIRRGGRATGIRRRQPGGIRR